MIHTTRPYNTRVIADKVTARQAAQTTRTLHKLMNEAWRSNKTVEVKLNTGSTVNNVEATLTGGRFGAWTKEGKHVTFTSRMVKDMALVDWEPVEVGSTVCFHNGNSYEHGVVKEATVITEQNHHLHAAIHQLGVTVYKIVQRDRRTIYDVRRCDIFYTITQAQA